MTTLKNTIKKENDFITKNGGVWAISEFHQDINDIQREKIKAFKSHYGACFLGKINSYNNKPIELIEYNGQKIYNFEYDFCIPSHDDELLNLIIEYNKPDPQGYSTSRAYEKVNKISNRIASLNGLQFLWV